MHPSRIAAGRIARCPTGTPGEVDLRPAVGCSLAEDVLPHGGSTLAGRLNRNADAAIERGRRVPVDDPTAPIPRRDGRRFVHRQLSMQALRSGARLRGHVQATLQARQA